MDTFKKYRNVNRRLAFTAVALCLLMSNFECIFKKSHDASNFNCSVSYNQRHSLCNSSNFERENSILLALGTLDIRSIRHITKYQYITDYYVFNYILDKQQTVNINTTSKCCSSETVCCNSTEITHYKPFTSKLILAVAVTLFFLILSYHISYIDTFDDKEKTSRGMDYGFVFQLWYKPMFKIDVYHFSLKKYVNKIERKSDKGSKHMVHEWARLESFQTFPKQCPVSTLRLAQIGFYSTGKGVEAICFCCGLKNEYWTEDESALELHKRLSPSCRFIQGEETENVPIHGFSTVNQAENAGACGGPNDNLENQRSYQPEHKKRVQQHLKSSQETELTPHANTHESTHENTSLENGNMIRRFEDNFTEVIEYFPGIPNERPKHPEYAVRAERFSSFSSWSASNVMTPDALTEAGFFFTGMQDLVRCFFCDGGMKNWEYGDSPWIEHARWFPTCAYLKLCKGQEFVHLCQISGMTFSTQDNFQLREIDSQQTIVIEDRQITDLNSIAAKRVFNMGYSQPQIEEAVGHVRQTIGQSQMMRAQHLLEYLLEKCHLTSDVTIQSTSTTETEHSNTLNIDREVTSNEHKSLRSSTEDIASGEGKDKEERLSLKEENRILKEQIMCKICLDKDANTVFLPCGHLVACVECANAIRKCAICRKIIQGTVRAYPA